MDLLDRLADQVHSACGQVLRPEQGDSVGERGGTHGHHRGLPSAADRWAPGPEAGQGDPALSPSRGLPLESLQDWVSWESQRGWGGERRGPQLRPALQGGGEGGTVRWMDMSKKSGDPWG